jgi:hypothetical protein
MYLMMLGRSLASHLGGAVSYRHRIGLYICEPPLSVTLLQPSGTSTGVEHEHKGISGGPMQMD